MYNISVHDYERISYIKDSDHDSFKIKTGEYAGVILTYGSVAITEPTDSSSDYGTLSFEFMINHAPQDNAEELDADNNFKQYIGKMLEVIITEALDNEQFAIGKKDELASNNDTKDLDN